MSNRSRERAAALNATKDISCLWKPHAVKVKTEQEGEKAEIGYEIERAYSAERVT